MHKTKLLKINKISALANRMTTLYEIVELLESCEIKPVGNLTNTSKLEILRGSLSQADPAKVDDFFSKFQEKKVDNTKSAPVKLPLHKEFIGTKVEKFLKTGDWDEAVRVACVRIVNRIKKLSGLNEDGVPLVQKAFSPNNPILRLSKIQDEQIGLMSFFVGSVFAFRNPPSHDDENRWLKEECISKLHIANYLMNVLDKAEKVDRIDEEISVSNRLSLPISN